MGLDVRVYGNIKITENEENADFVAHVIDASWRRKVKNLEYGKRYTGDMIFRGVSYAYSSHNVFRSDLLKVIDRFDLLDSTGRIKWEELPTDLPFIDLIDFADNEGCLDWEISEKIYLDFEKYNQTAKDFFSDHNYNIYSTWMKTFESAKNNRGVVDFG